MNTNEGISKKKDPTWKHTILINPPDTLKHKCPFCGKISTGGITRAKEHLIGTSRRRKNITLCNRVPDEVKEELKAYEEKQASIKRQANLEEHVPDFDDGKDMLEIDEEEGQHEIQGRQASLGKEKAHTTSATSKVSSMVINMRSDSVGGPLSKRRDLWLHFLLLIWY